MSLKAPRTAALRRLRRAAAHLHGGGATPLSAASELPEDIPDPIGFAENSEENGRPGNWPLGEHIQGCAPHERSLFCHCGEPSAVITADICRSARSYGIIKHHPPPFDPQTQEDEAFQFYHENGYVVVNSLSEQEVTDLNAVCDEFVHDRGEEIDVPGQGQLVFPLLEYPEFDFTVVHPNTLPLVQRILGGKDIPRLIGALI